MLTFHKTEIRVSVVVQQTSHEHLSELIASKLHYYTVFGLYQFKKLLELEPHTVFVNMSKRSSFFGFLPPLSPTKRSSSTSSSPSPSAISQLVRFAGSAQMLTEEVSAQSMTTDEGKATFHYTVCLRAQTRFGWSCGICF